MFDMPLEKHWLGPTIYTWGKDQCDKIRSFYRDNLGDCKKTCEDWESCNAIIVKNAICNERPCIMCQLKNCTFPVSAPCGPKRECIGNNLEDPDYRGYYRATGKKEIYI